jgi:hypothetical protein
MVSLRFNSSFSLAFVFFTLFCVSIILCHFEVKLREREKMSRLSDQKEKRSFVYIHCDDELKTRGVEPFRWMWMEKRHRIGSN